MAVYKVIQDVEAEDKILGPLTLKQFIFAAVAVAFGFLAFTVASRTSFLVIIPFLPFILVPGVLAAPFGRDQPTDIWLAAQIRFFTKPRKRIWDQSGQLDLVTITAPKVEEKQYTDGLSQQEVQGRLKALAEMIDSHGWAAKNVDVSLYSTPAMAPVESDRLINPASLPQTVPEVDITAADDIMDAVSNPTAQHFDELVKEAAQTSKDAAIAKMQAAAKSPGNSSYEPRFANQPHEKNTVMFDAAFVRPGEADQHNAIEEAQHKHFSATEEAVLSHTRLQRRESYQHMPHHKVIKTPEEIAKEQQTKNTQQNNPQTPVTPPKNPAIVNLANTDDLSVGTIQGLANRQATTMGGEGEIKLR